MQKYVLGFLFDRFLSEVVLIEKLRPEWQKGLLNGVGGKIETGETALEAMRREFKEETSVDISAWKSFCDMSGKDFLVKCYCSTYIFDKIRSNTDEKVNIYNVDDLPFYVIPNLKWLIPMAIDSFNEDLPVEFAKVTYK